MLPMGHGISLPVHMTGVQKSETDQCGWCVKTHAAGVV